MDVLSVVLNSQHNLNGSMSLELVVTAEGNAQTAYLARVEPIPFSVDKKIIITTVHKGFLLLVRFDSNLYSRLLLTRYNVQ